VLQQPFITMMSSVINGSGSQEAISISSGERLHCPGCRLCCTTVVGGLYCQDGLLQQTIAKMANLLAVGANLTI